MMFSKFFGKKMFSYSSKQIMEMEYNLGCHNYAPWPVVASKGERVYIWDVEGKKYYDLIAGIGACNQGHVHPKILKEFVHQASQLTLVSRVFYNDQLALLHKKLNGLFGYDKSILMNGGVQSGETAIKMARRWAYNVKKVPDNQAQVIFAKGNFWGRTIAACGSSDDPYRYKNFGPYQGLKFKLIDYNNLQALQNALKSNPNVAAFMVEPIQGEKGVIIPNKGYLKGVSQLCKKHKVLLISDQVQTGLGRTGKMFGFQHEGIRPDLVCLGKSFSGGFMPIAGVLGDNHIFDQISPGEHGSTYGGNPLASRTVMAALDVIIEQNLVENSQKMGKIFMQNLKRIFDPKGRNGKYIKQVRGLGLFIAIQFQGDNMADKVAKKLLQKGVILKPTHKHILKLTPALVINQKQVKDICSKFEQVWKQIEQA